MFHSPIKLQVFVDTSPNRSVCRIEVIYESGISLRCLNKEYILHKEITLVFSYPAAKAMT